MKGRRHGSVIIEKFEHKGHSVVIYLNKEESIFTSTLYPGRHLKDKNLNTLRREITNDLDSLMSSETKWIPVIKLSEVRPWSHDEGQLFLGFDLERLYIAHRKDGRWLEAEWNSSPEDRFKRAKTFDIENFELPYTEVDSWDAKTFWLKYKDDLWAGLKKLEMAIIEAKEKLYDLLGTDQGRKRIEMAGKEILKALELKTFSKEQEKEIRDYLAKKHICGD